MPIHVKISIEPGIRELFLKYNTKGKCRIKNRVISDRNLQTRGKQVNKNIFNLCDSGSFVGF